MRSIYAGVDWASEKHDVLIADETGEKILAATFAHDEVGVRSLCRTLVRHEVTLVAIERPDGLLVERLLDAGLRILPLHPNQVAATRDRFRASGGKSDRFDAFVLCELARTDHHRFRVLEPDSDQTKALRALTRAREDLVGTRTALTNQLRAELERFWPGPLGMFRDLHSRISLAFLERYPSPEDARGLGEARLHGFLVREHYTGSQKPARLLAKLRRAPEARVGELELATRRRLVLALVATIKSLNSQIKDLERQIASAVREHPDGRIFLSLFKKPGSVICAAELLAEIGDCRARYPTRDTLAADAGQAAVAKESGKYKAACFRWACNKRLRGAVGTLADTTRHHNPWAQDLYARARQRGHDHPRAIRSLGRAWCRILWRCWQDRVPYDPARHRALQKHITVTIPTLSGPVVDDPATQRMLAGAVATTTAPQEQEVTAAP
jgi:transposase